MYLVMANKDGNSHDAVIIAYDTKDAADDDAAIRNKNLEAAQRKSKTNLYDNFRYYVLGIAEQRRVQTKLSDDVVLADDEQKRFAQYRQ